MTNPFIKKIPTSTDIKIRFRILMFVVKKYRTNRNMFFLGVLSPLISVWLFVFLTSINLQPDIDILAQIRMAEASELAKAEEGIYHLRWYVTEGVDKPRLVANNFGREINTIPRTDVLETWQHGDNVLAFINSNALVREFDVYLSIAQDDDVSLHHYGGNDREVDSNRYYYDEVHDLSSIYTAYTSLERPGIPKLPKQAEMVKVDETNRQTIFSFKPNDKVIIESVVDMETMLVKEEIIYLSDENNEWYQVTRISYESREIIPATDFEDVFDPEIFDYQLMTTS